MLGKRTASRPVYLVGFTFANRRINKSFSCFVGMQHNCLNSSANMAHVHQNDEDLLVCLRKRLSLMHTATSGENAVKILVHPKLSPEDVGISDEGSFGLGNQSWQTCPSP